MARRLEMTKVGIVDAKRKARLAEMVVHTCTLAFESGGRRTGHRRASAWTSTCSFKSAGQGSISSCG